MNEIFEIPLEVDEDYHFKLTTVLEDIQLILRFDWIERQLRWVLSIYDANEVLLVASLPLNINVELIERLEIIGLPPGRLILYDTTEKFIECGFKDLGDRCKLLYEMSI
jgi:hypothetical protein